jgi:hypothetical protein
LLHVCIHPSGRNLASLKAGCRTALVYRINILDRPRSLHRSSFALAFPWFKAIVVRYFILPFGATGMSVFELGIFQARRSSKVGIG